MQRITSVGFCRPALSLLAILQLAIVSIAAPISDNSKPPLACSVLDLEFAGQQNFDDKTIRRALNADSRVAAFLSSAETNHDVDAFGKLICDRLSVGYHSMGYVNAAFTVTRDAKTGKLRIEICQGVPQRRGVVRIEAPADILADELGAAITGMREGKFVRPDFVTSDGSIADRFPSVWKQGDAPGDLIAAAEQAKKAALLWCELQGYLFPTIDVSTAASSDQKTVDLIVRIVDTGSKLQISTVEFEGLSRHSSDDLRKFLDLPADVLYSEQLAKRIVSKLEASGRFRFVRVWPEIPFGPEQAVPLHIQVAESDHVPLLGEPLSEAESCLLQFAGWLNNWDDGKDNLHVQSSIHFEPPADTAPEKSKFDFEHFASDLLYGVSDPQSVDTVVDLTPDGGMIVNVQAIARDGRETPARRMYVNENGLGLSVAGSHYSWSQNRASDGILFSFSMRDNPDSEQAPDYGAIFKFHFRQGLPQAMDVRIGAPAAIVLDMLHSDEYPVAFIRNADGTASFTGEGLSLVVNGESGRLVNLTCGSKTSRFSVDCETGKYEKAVLALQKEIAQQQDMGVRKQLIVSASRFLLAEYSQVLRANDEGGDARLIDAFVIGRPIEALTAFLQNHKSAEWFSIPSENAVARSESSGVIAGLTAGLGEITREFHQNSAGVSGNSVVADQELQNAVSEAQIAKGIASTIREMEYAFAVIRYVIAVGQSLGDEEGERLASLVETGEVLESTRGVNIRPFLRLLQSQKSVAPEEVYHHVFPLLWSSTLKQHFTVECTSLTGGGPDGTEPQFSWNFRFGKPQPPTKSVSSSRVLPTAPSVQTGDVRLDQAAEPEKNSTSPSSFDPIEIPSPGAFKRELKNSKLDGANPFQ